jgi:hypothetical protein
MQSDKCFRAIILVLFFHFFSLFQLSYAQTSHGEHGGVKLEISLEKTEYLVGEVVWLDIKATNITDHDIEVPPLELLYTQWFKVVIVGPDGDTLRHLGLRANTRGYVKGTLLSPRESYYNYEEIGGVGYQFGKRNNPYRGTGIPLPLAEGTYSIQAVYLGNLSNKLEFRTINPVGDEKKAYELLKLGYKYRPIRTVDKSIENFKALLELYPNSVYAAEACYHLFGIFRSHKQDLSSWKQYAELLISRYPSSGNVKYVMHDLIESKTDKEKIEWLQDIEKKYPETRVALKAKEIRQSLSKKCQNE